MRLNQTMWLVLMLGVVFVGGCANSGGAEGDGGVDLFDGESMAGWHTTLFGGEGQVYVEDGEMVLMFGDNITGVTWDGEPPARMDYEIELEAMRVSGSDFFVALTFPINDDPCSLIVGGWGGGVVGLSNLDGMDAANNDTSAWETFENGRWYNIRLRVTKGHVDTWIDDEQIIDADLYGRPVSIRPEVELSKPLGISNFQSTSAIRKIRFYKLPESKEPDELFLYTK